MLRIHDKDKLLIIELDNIALSRNTNGSLLQGRLNRALRVKDDIKFLQSPVLRLRNTEKDDNRLTKAPDAENYERFPRNAMQHNRPDVVVKNRHDVHN